MATAIKTYRLQEGLYFSIFVLLLTYIILAVYDLFSDYALGVLFGVNIALIIVVAAHRLLLANDLKILQRLFSEARRAKRLRISEKFAIAEMRDFGIKLEESLLLRQKKIEELIEQTYSTNVLLNNMREGMVVVDSQMSVLLLNRASLQLLKVEPNSQINTLQKIIRNNALIESVKYALENETGFELMVSKYLTTNQSFLFRGSILRDAEETLMGILILIQDVSELEKLQNMRKDFVANVSHELRTPITAIKGYVETLLDANISLEPSNANVDNANVDNATSQRFLGIIKKHVGRLEDLVEDILELSTIEKEEQQGWLTIEEFAISDFCNEIAERFDSQAQAKNISFELNFSSPACVSTNRQLLDQAFSNLISNAIKYSPNSAIISVEQRQQGDLIQLYVKDQGPGIDEQYRERIFERFYRVDFGRGRDVGGTGLGLAIVKHAMKVISGTVTLETEFGKGSCFILTFPNKNLTIEK